MIIGIPKEIKNNEYRVASIPADVEKLISNGHKVLIEHNAGNGSGYTDSDYQKVGANIINDKERLFQEAQLIYKVKEILPPEYHLVQKNHILFTYIHSNSDIEQTDLLLNREVTAIAYEDICDENGNYPLLEPMSEIAGKGGFLKALEYSQKINNGKGLMLCRVTGNITPHITVIGGGTAGQSAAELAARLGNKVTVLDIDIKRLKTLEYQLPNNVELLYSDRASLVQCLRVSDVIINCVLWPKWRQDHLIYKEDLKLMKENALIVDVSCDEKGAIETSRPTTHENPTYQVDNILHYCVDNIPGAFSQTATRLLSKSTINYALMIANKGVKQALKEHKELRKGLTCYNGLLTLEETAKKQKRNYITPEKAIEY